MTLRIWKGYHSPSLKTLIAKSWENHTLLILCPPLLQDFSFLSALPPGPTEIHGQWSESERVALASIPRRGSFPGTESPILGVFTSGTLSHTPRLVLYTKRGVLASLKGIFALFDTRKIRHLFCYPQAFHTFGLTLGYLASHVMGWELHTPEGKYQRTSHAQRIALREEHVLTLGTPTHFFDLLSVTKETGAKLYPSDSCIMGGASVSRELWMRVRDELQIAAPSIGYGCTEAAPGISHLPPGQAPENDGEIGYPLTSIRSRLIPDQGVEISGESLCFAVIQNGLIEFPRSFLIRDRIETAPNGAWIYRGRLDLLMNRGGAKYSLELIEKTVQDRLGIAAVACGVRDARLGEDLAMTFVQSSENSNEQIFDNASRLIQDVFALDLKPEKTRYVSDLPLNECSKLDRKSIWTFFT